MCGGVVFHDPARAHYIPVIAHGLLPPHHHHHHHHPNGVYAFVVVGGTSTTTATASPSFCPFTVSFPRTSHVSPSRCVPLAVVVRPFAGECGGRVF